MSSDSQRLKLLKDVLKFIFGLDQETVHRVVGIVKGSTGTSKVRTPIVRQRIGNRAMSYLKNSIKISKDEGSERHKDKDDAKNTKRDKSKDNDNSRLRYNKSDENITFKGYLLSEDSTVMMDVDLEDKNATRSQLKRAQRVNNQSPERLQKEIRQKAAAEQQAARANKQDPNAQLKAQAARKKMELADTERRLISAEKRTSGAA